MVKANHALSNSAQGAKSNHNGIKRVSIHKAGLKSTVKDYKLCLR